jgi:hypothetical protein
MTLTAGRVLMSEFAHLIASAEIIFSFRWGGNYRVSSRLRKKLFTTGPRSIPPDGQ